MRTTSDRRIQEKIRQLRWVSLITGLLMSAGFAIIYNLTADKETISPNLVIAVTMRVFGGWLTVLGILGMGMQCLNVRTPRLGYANEAVLPFYIFHQTVLLAVGYFVLQWGLPEVLEWREKSFAGSLNQISQKRIHARLPSERSRACFFHQPIVACTRDVLPGLYWISNGYFIELAHTEIRVGLQIVNQGNVILCSLRVLKAADR